jgi:hypothetical protein
MTMDVWGGMARGAGRLVVGMSCVLLAAAAFAAGSASADSFTWYPPIGLDQAGGGRSLSAVVCPPTASKCTTVDNAGQQVTFDPTSGATSTSTAVDLVGSVTALACPSASQCTAVDTKGDESTFSPLSGAVNSVGVHSIDPSYILTSVSCASGTQCTAVDQNGDEVTFDPASGAVTGNAEPPVESGTNLSSVSCLSNGTQCVAVDTKGNEVTFNPATGSVAGGSAQNIDGTNSLMSVSCLSGGQCTAVDNKGNEVTFAAGASPAPGVHQVDGTTALSSVSCPSSSQCSATDSLGNEVTFAPSTGAIVGTATQIDGTTYLASVSCASTSQCVAVDNRGNEITFAPTATPGAALRSVDPKLLASLSCPSLTQCTVVDNGADEITFDPTTGAIAGTGLYPIDTTGNPLAAVSCPGTTECTAVDHSEYETTFNPQTGQRNNAGSFPVDINALEALSCPSSTQCTAVDATGNEVTFDPSAGMINNQALTPIDASTKPLQAVSCPSTSQCTAVDGGGNEVTFNPNYTGSQTPNPNVWVSVDSGAGIGGLTSVSCPSATQCTAVDVEGNEVTFDPTTATSNTATVTSLIGAGLTSVFCPTSTQCTTVDGSGQEITFNPSSPAGAMPTSIPAANSLDAVDCNTTYECVVADQEGNAFAGFVPPSNTAPPTITGHAQQGFTLTEHAASWSNYPPSSYAYQWERCDSSGGQCFALVGQTSPTYQLTADDVGHTLRVQETATNLGGPSQPSTSAATAVVVPPPPSNTSPPMIAGTARQADTLSEQQGSWTYSPPTFTYQWQDCDSSGNNCSAIAGATAQTYKLSASDVGHTVRVLETASNAGGTSSPASSAPTAVVAPAAAAAIVATTKPATSVGATTSVLDGQLYTQGAPVSWEFQWGLTSAYGSATPVQTIAAGTTTLVPVAWTLSGLAPNTTYHYRVIEVVSPGPYRVAVTSTGQDLTFTTVPTGKLTLGSRHLKVVGKKAAISLHCLSSIDCIGRLWITTRGRIGKFGPVKAVLCVSSFEHVPAGQTDVMKVTILPACRAILSHTGNHLVFGQLTASPRTGQTGIARVVTLKLVSSRNKTARR